MSKQRPARVTHITFAHALARMVCGPFSRSDIAQVTGLHPSTVSKLTASMAKAGAVRVRNEKACDTKGRKSVEMFELASKKF